MSTRANTTVDVSRRCYKVIKPLVCLACIVACLAGLVPFASAITHSPTMSSYNLVTLTAHPFGDGYQSFTNAVWGNAKAFEVVPPLTQQVDYTFVGDDAYFFDQTNPIYITGYFCLEQNKCLSILVDYEGGNWSATYNGYIYRVKTEEGYIEQAIESRVSGNLSLTIGSYDDFDGMSITVLPIGTYSEEYDYYFVGEIEIMVESYGDVTFGLRNMLYDGDNISPLFHTTGSLDIVQLPAARYDANNTYNTGYILDGTLFYTPSVKVDVLASPLNHSWLLRSIEPVFNTPIFSSNFTLGALIIILLAIALLALILKLSFGG